ncbi:hypothetical protein V5P93_004236 [Actinokineospora auranticolor]|uniref:Uncharacterized protein n=1 Tax=Actinokineospora auranticolor TaxID=155976 RepID=A0A2S6GIH4_9PSEU|nr:FHA domain-containing protein [Actinokineospora auranticolor]PPK65019.1 hypothetical protein CLV40_11662 [Actinokineospora auranticolor]
MAKSARPAWRRAWATPARKAVLGALASVAVALGAAGLVQAGTARTALLIGACTAFAALIAAFLVQLARSAAPVPGDLDGTTVDNSAAADAADAALVRDPDFLALGLGGTNMMAMLWTVAMGKRAVGVEMRGDPSLGVHWNIREDLYHHFGLIDQMMLERYGADGVPKRGNGTPFLLAECFYHPDTAAGAVAADEVVTGFLDSHIGEDAHVSGIIHHTEFIDDRWADGRPQRVVTVVDSALPPTDHDPSKIGRPMVEVLDGPSTFQAGASEVLILQRRYLEAIERMDLERGARPRVRLFTSHRVVTPNDDGGYLNWLRRDEGFTPQRDGRMGVRIEQIRELDYKGKFRRVRVPGTEVLDLGVPELFMIAQGFDSTDATRLGFRQEEVKVDHQDGRGPVVAQADYLAGLMEVLVDGRLRRRIASEFDKQGNEYWVRQIAVGHQDDPEVGWILVQVPDFKTFDPILAGLVPPGTDRKAPEYFAAYQYLLRDFYLEQVSHIVEIPREELESVQIPYGPKLFSLVEQVGADALVAANGVVAGDSFGNGHFLTSGGAITGMVGHGARVLRYWEARAAGADQPTAVRGLADGIKADTDGWLHVSAQEFSQAVPINFGAERIERISAASGKSTEARANTIDATRRHRHSLVPLDPSDWRRLVIRSGRTHALSLPPLSQVHPALRGSGEVAGESSDVMADEAGMTTGNGQADLAAPALNAGA